MEKNMENEMETREHSGVILGLYGNNGKENGNYYSIRNSIFIGADCLLRLVKRKLH